MTVRNRWIKRLVIAFLASSSLVAFAALGVALWQDRGPSQNRLSLPSGVNSGWPNPPYAIPVSQTPTTTYPPQTVHAGVPVAQALPAADQRSLVGKILSMPLGSNEKVGLVNEFRSLVEKEFEGRLEEQGKELAAIEKRLTEAKAKLALRTEKKQEIIDRRVNELLQVPDELAWSTPNIVPPTPALSNPSFLVSPYPNVPVFNPPGYNPRAVSQTSSAPVPMVGELQLLESLPTPTLPLSSPPLSNLFVSMLRRLEIPVDKFSTSTGTVSGLELKP